MVQKPVWNSAMRVNHQNSVRMTHPHSKWNVAPTAVLTRSRLVSLNAARPVTIDVTKSTVKCTRPAKNVFHKAYSPSLKKSMDDMLHLDGILKVLRDENHVLLRVPREINMYNVDLKNVVPLGDPKNIDDNVADDAFEVKENENDVHVFAHESDKTNKKKHDAKATRDDKGKSHVDLITGVRDLRAEFEEFSFNNTSRVNAVSEPVNAAGANPTNSTTSFCTANTPELKEIVYSNDEEDVGAKADLSNLETNIPLMLPLWVLWYIIWMSKVLLFMEPLKKRYMFVKLLDLKTLAYPDKVYKVVKALYGLHQAPRAWYETLANYLLENGFQRGKIDQNLFIKKQKGDILLVQVYVDDIIFGSTNKELCKVFEKLIKDKFQMSSIGELTFFLGLQVKQKEDGIFITQDKYVAKILRKFGFTDVKSASTPIETKKPLLKDLDGEDVGVHIYRSMIGSLMYLTSSRPDIMFAVCASARFQVTPKVLHLHAIKRIFSAKRTAWNEFSSSMASAVIYLATSRKFNFSKYIFENMVRNMDSSSVETPIFDSMLVQSQPKAEECVEVTITHAQPSTTSASSPTDLQDTTPTPHDTPPPYQPPTPYNLPLQDQPTTPHASPMPLLTTLMETCATLSQKVSELEKEKNSQALEILQLNKRVKRLERKKKSKTLGGKIAAIDADKGITLVDVETNEEEVIMDAESQERTHLNDASKGVSAVIAPKLVSIAEPTVFDDEYSAIGEQVKERQSDSIKRYQYLKKKPVSVAQARKNMMVYLKNMAGYKMEFFKGMTYDEIRSIFERYYNKECFKKLRAAEVSESESTQEIPTDDLKEITKEDV
nr:putative ribonuclease H-like domain-containing protein [Tanacetum cinerariifolium]